MESLALSLEPRLKTEPRLCTTWMRKSMLEIHEEIDRDVNGKRILIVEDVGDYRDVDGVKLAHSFVSGPKEDPRRTKLTIDKYTLNATVDPQLFAKPVPAGQ